MLWATSMSVRTLAAPLAKPQHVLTQPSEPLPSAQLIAADVERIVLAFIAATPKSIKEPHLYFDALRGSWLARLTGGAPESALHDA